MLIQAVAEVVQPEEEMRKHLSEYQPEAGLVDLEFCLFEILKYLSFKQRVKCERVCQKWRQKVKQVNGTQQTSLAILGGSNKIQNFCPCPGHRVIPLLDCIHVSDIRGTTLSAVLRKVVNLKSLHIRCEDENIFDEDEAENIGNLCPNLEHFSFVDDFRGLAIYDEVTKIIESCPNLKHLQLRFPYTASGKMNELFAENVIIKSALNKYKANLEILSINVPLNKENCTILSNYCRLRKLSLHGTTIPLPGLNTFVNEGNVRGKYLRCLSIVIDSQDQLKLICRQMIGLQSFHCVVSNVKSIATIGQLRNLKNLFLSCWSNEIIDEGLLKIMMGCNQLTCLTINADVSDSSLRHLGAFCPFIERLEVNNSKAYLLSDLSIQSFANMEYLNSFTLYYCDVTDEGLLHLLSACHEYLEYLKVTYSNSLTPKSLDYCNNFALEKPWKQITIKLPVGLKRSFTRSALHNNVPRNLDLSFAD